MPSKLLCTYLISRLSSTVLSFNTPYEMLFQQSPNYQRLKPFGCLCFPWLRPYSTSKLQSRSTSCVFLGYSTSQFAYKCFDPTTNRVYLSRHIQFVEHVFPHQVANNSDIFSNHIRDAFLIGSK